MPKSLFYPSEVVSFKHNSSHTNLRQIGGLGLRVEYSTEGWNNLPLLAIFEKRHVSADQVYFIIQKSTNFAVRAARFPFSKNLR